jgi:hypothetical protein
MEDRLLKYLLSSLVLAAAVTTSAFAGSSAHGTNSSRSTAPTTSNRLSAPAPSPFDHVLPPLSKTPTPPAPTSSTSTN